MTPSPTGRRVTLAAIACAAALALVALSGCDAVLGLVTASDTVQRSLDTQVTTVRVEMFNGSIAVSPGPPGSVAATVTRTGQGRTHAAALADAALIDVTLTETDGQVVLRAVHPSAPGGPERRGASAVVTVPATATVTLVTSNGPITVSGLTGSVDAGSSNGEISLTGATTDARARSSNGRIVVRGGAGTYDLETSNGAIDVQAEGTRVAAKTSNGPIDVAGSLGSGDTRLVTSNGAVTVTLPADASFDIDATTSNGTIKYDFVVMTTDAPTATRLTGHVGQPGGASVVIEDSNGDIRILAAR